MVSVAVMHFGYLGTEHCGYKWLVSNLFDMHLTNIIQISVENLNIVALVISSAAKLYLRK